MGHAPRHDLSTQWGRFLAYLHPYLEDHAFLRVPWTHMHEIAPGAWRSNQPSPRRLSQLKRAGFRSVLMLRGMLDKAPAALEIEACERLGLDLHTVGIGGGAPASRERFLELLDAFRVIEGPFGMHCKSGIDRTGFAAFLFLLSETDTPPEIARRQLSFDYLHLRHGRHGILDLMADTYLAEWRETGIGIRDWIATSYDPEKLMSEWRGKT